MAGHRLRFGDSIVVRSMEGNEAVLVSGEFQRIEDDFVCIKGDTTNQYIFIPMRIVVRITKQRKPGSDA